MVTPSLPWTACSSVLDNSSGKEIFPCIQLKPLLVHLEAVLLSYHLLPRRIDLPPPSYNWTWKQTSKLYLIGKGDVLPSVREEPGNTSILRSNREILINMCIYRAGLGRRCVCVVLCVKEWFWRAVSEEQPGTGWELVGKIKDQTNRGHLRLRVFSRGLSCWPCWLFQPQQHLHPKLSSSSGFQSSRLSSGRAAQLALSNPGDSWRVLRTTWSRYCQKRSVTGPGAHRQISWSEIKSGAAWAVVTLPLGSLWSWGVWAWWGADSGPSTLEERTSSYLKDSHMSSGQI